MSTFNTESNLHSEVVTKLHEKRTNLNVAQQPNSNLNTMNVEECRSMQHEMVPSKIYNVYDEIKFFERPMSLGVQATATNLSSTKSNSLCSSPILCRKTREEHRTSLKPRPMSTTIEFPLRKTILRQMSLTMSNSGSYNSLKPNSCSSSSSVCSFKSSSELSNSSHYLSNNERFESTISPSSRIRRKRAHQIPNESLRRQSWGCNPTQPSTNSIQRVNNFDSTTSAHHSPNPTSRSSTPLEPCHHCLKAKLNIKVPLKNQRFICMNGESDEATKKRRPTSLRYSVNPYKYFLLNKKDELLLSNKKSDKHVVNLVKFNLNRLGSSMPNLCSSTFCTKSENCLNGKRRLSIKSSISSSFNRTNIVELNEDFHSLTSSLASSSFLNQNVSTYSPSCQCSMYNESASTNNSPLTPSVPQLAFTGLRSDLRPRNSSASSFSGSPVAKIEEEIDPIDDFDFQTKIIAKSDLFFVSIPSHMAPNRAESESPFNSPLSSQSSAALNTPPAKVDTYKKLLAKPELCKNLFPSNHSKNKDIQLQPGAQQEAEPTNYSLAEHQSRPLNRTNNTILPIQLDAPHEYNNTDVVYSNYYPSDYQRTRARSLNNSSPRNNQECDIIRLRNERFKNKFPTACKKMKRDLSEFISLNSDPIRLENWQLDPIVRFIHNQIIEIAKLCLEKTEKSQLTCAYFDEITNSLEQLLVEAKDKCNEETKEISVQNLRKFVEKLLLIVVHTARLLECFEFDQSEFFSLLDAAEASTNRDLIETSIPKYIVSKLGLNRDSFKDLVNVDSSEKLMKLNVRSSQLESIKKEAPNEKDFNQIKLISNGAYGAVHLVRHKNGERYAMKKIKKRDLILKNQLQQVFTERDIMIFTDNPFVVALICTFETRTSLCMVMEYVEGGDVATLIQNMGPLSLDIARVYFAEATLAVEYLHNYGIIHRDLKPDNFLITSIGHIKLTDFGLSKVGLMNLTSNIYDTYQPLNNYKTKVFNDKQICGTPQYLPPEVILRQGYGKTVDWWSMGIILYEFLTSFTPFNGNTPEELFSTVISGEILWPDVDDIIKITPESKDLILRLLTHDPLLRLGAGGAIEIKNHEFFSQLHWDNLLFRKADFIPDLEGPDDTSYFDTRSERYNHESFDELKSPRQCQQDFTRDDGISISSDQNELFASFSSYTSRFQDSLDILSVNSVESVTAETSEGCKDINGEKFNDEDLMYKEESVEKGSVEKTGQKEMNILNTFLQRVKDIEEFAITKSSMGYGFTWQEHKVYFEHGNMITGPYMILHFIDNVDPNGPAHRVGLRKNFIITHVNGQLVSGNTHCELMRRIFKTKNTELMKLKAVHIKKTRIRSDNNQKYIGKIPATCSHPSPKQIQSVFGPIKSNNHYKFYNRSTKNYEPRTTYTKSSKRPSSYPNDIDCREEPTQNSTSQNSCIKVLAKVSGENKDLRKEASMNKGPASMTQQVDVGNKPNACASAVNDDSQAYSERVKSLIPLSLKKLIKDYLIPNQSLKTKQK